MTTVVQCPRDPGVETALRCSRCDTPICPRCLVMSPVGARCKDCAKLAKNPIYSLETSHFVRAAAAAVIGGVVMGLIWGFVLLPFTVGFFSIILGAVLSWVFTRVMDFATGRKRGPVVAGFAIGGIAIAWAMTLLFIPFQIGLYGLVAAGIGVYLCWQNLSRF
ncbi:MAG: hypothetical protein ACM3S1_15970 [Hyphomicrobiales bacterium]